MAISLINPIHNRHELSEEKRKLNQNNLFDNVFWEEFVSSTSELSDESYTREQLVYRFLGQYLPALLAAKTQENRDRAWRALWSYMTSPVTMAKPFSLSYSSADDLIANIQEQLSRLGIELQ